MLKNFVRWILPIIAILIMATYMIVFSVFPSTFAAQPRSNGTTISTPTPTPTTTLGGGVTPNGYVRPK